MKYRIEWMREKKNVYWQAKQQCVVYDDESALHIMKNLQKDPKVSLIDVIPVLWKQQQQLIRFKLQHQQDIYLS